jgi:signal transduction histidine kinase
MNNKVILCVDDEKIVLESLRSELEGKFEDQYILEFAESGAEALEVITELIADGDLLALIITDYLMPGLKGDEILAKMCKEQPDSKQIMLTGQASLEGITNAINNAKLYRYIAKPWEKSDLLLTIKEAIKSYEQEIQLKEHQKILEETVRQRTCELEKTLVELKESQDQLVASEKMAVLGGLVAGIAHEINTPVGVGVTAASHMESKIREIVKLYEEDELTREDYEEFLHTAIEGAQIILRNLQTAANLVSSFKQVAVDQSSEAVRAFKLRQYIDEILMTLNPELKYTKIRIEVDCPDDLALDSYPGDFSQIFTNLIMNSIAHGFNGGKDPGNIRIRIERDGAELVIRYSDDGMGIPDHILNRIFDPFVTTDRNSGRSGLGMHIIYNIITHRLKGSIVCENTLQKGALFVIRMPVTINHS